MERGISSLSITAQDDDEDDVKRHFEMSPEDFFKAKHGDKGQGDFLISRRQKAGAGSTETPSYEGKDLLSYKAEPFTT